MIIGSGNQLPEKLIGLPTLPNLGKLPRRKIYLSMKPRLDKELLAKRFDQQALSRMQMLGQNVMNMADSTRLDMSRPDKGTFDIYRSCSPSSQPLNSLIWLIAISFSMKIWG